MGRAKVPKIFVKFEFHYCTFNEIALLDFEIPFVQVFPVFWCID